MWHCHRTYNHTPKLLDRDCSTRCIRRDDKRLEQERAVAEALTAFAAAAVAEPMCLAAAEDCWR